MKKLQAAMEYLMTYGWAILIIALALGVLYSLGVFNPNRLKPVGCFLPAPFTCQIVSVNTGGVATIILGQGSGQTITINSTACVDNTRPNNNGIPSTSSDWSTPIPSISGGSLTIPSGGSVSLTNIYCINPSGSRFNGTIGSTFSGSLIIKYTVGSSSSSTFYYSVGSISAQINTQ